MSELRVGELAAVATAVLWTFSTLAWTSAGNRIGALAVAFIRLTLAAALLMAYGRLFRGQWLPLDAPSSAWLLLGVSGAFGFFLSDLCQIKAYLLIGPRLALLISALTPPMTAVVAWVSIGDVLTPRHWVAMGITLSGVVWVASERFDEDTPHERRRHWVRGVLLSVFSAATMAVSLVMAKEGLRYCDAAAATSIRLVAAWPGYVVLVTLWHRWSAMWDALWEFHAISVLTFGTVIGPCVGVALSMVALRHAPAGTVATILATMPVLILPFSVLLHREKVGLRTVGGAIVAVAGVALLML